MAVIIAYELWLLLQADAWLEILFCLFCTVHSRVESIVQTLIVADCRRLFKAGSAEPTPPFYYLHSCPGQSG